MVLPHAIEVAKEFLVPGAQEYRRCKDLSEPLSLKGEIILFCDGTPSNFF
jgi:hypothetical protein